MPDDEALLDGTTLLHSVRRVRLEDLPGPYPQLDRGKAREHGLFHGVSEGDSPEPFRQEYLVTGDRITFTGQRS